MSIYIWSYKNLASSDGAPSGIGGGIDEQKQFVADLCRYGHAMVIDAHRGYSDSRGVWDARVAHDDAAFAEVGRSQAAYYENGEAFGGRWWESNSRVVRRGVYGAAA